MANNLVSNTTENLLKRFLVSFESQRVLTKTINKSILDGEVTNDTGGSVAVKRPHDYIAVETATGDISSAAENTIISGKASATVQPWITIPIPWTIEEEMLDLDQLDKIIAPAATRAITQLESNLGAYMIKNTALTYGTPGTAIDAWTDVSGAMAQLQSIGVPSVDMCYYTANPYSIANLASAQSGINAAPSDLVKTSWTKAQTSTPFAGMSLVGSNALSTWTAGGGADRIGALTSAPTQTYLAAKDTMTQSWILKDLTQTSTVKAGDILTVTGKYHVNGSSKQVFMGSDGAPVKFTATVTADATITSGAGTVIVTNAAIFESDGQYNNISEALEADDVVTISGVAGTVYQPALYYHPDAFGMTTLPIPKLFSTDTITVSEDGYTIRCSKYSDGDANTQKVRFDLVPVFATFNPLFAGKGFGV